MPRKKSAATKKAAREIEIDEIDLTPEEASAPALGRKITVERRILSQPLTASETRELESSDDDDADFDPQAQALEDFDADLVDGLAQDLLGFFDADGGDEGHKLRVFQMMKPGAGMKFQKGGMIYRGEIPYAPTFLKDVQENFGGGVFRLQVVGEWLNEKTGNMRFGIIKSRTVTIAAPTMPLFPDDPAQAQAQARNLTGGPHVPYLLTPPPAPADPPPTMREGLREVVEMVAMVDKLRGADHAQVQTQAPPVTDPEIAALTLIAKNPDVMDKIAGGITRTVMGRSADDDSWASVAKELIKSGQGPEIVAALIREVMAPFRQIFAGEQNGQAQMGAPTLPDNQMVDRNMPQAISESRLPQGEQQGAANPAQAGAHAPGQPMILPEDHALALLIEFCRRKAPPRVAGKRLLDYADQINDEAPQYSIDDYIDMFVVMTPAQAVEFVKTQPGGAAIAGLDYATAWTAELQAHIKQQVGESPNES